MDKVAIVTGSARGIGRGIAKHLAASGYAVVLNGVSPAPEPPAAGALEEAKAEIEAAGGTAACCRGDVAIPADRQKLIDFTRETFGRLDLLVNNAGTAPKVRADILQADEASFDQQISTNLKGPYFLTRLAANWMVEQKKLSAAYRGCIINISSFSSTIPSVNRGDYCISKAGISMATRLWAARLAEYGIDVYEIRPGIIATDMTSGVKAKYDALIASDAFLDKRWGTPDDIGKAAATLARGDIPYATGTVLTLDGGFTLQRL